ncbi:MAG: PqqD family protein [Gammaproteobacteria bacterium]|nr:PqqD family protein [Gammaproteobacteria bacterium]
MSSMVDPVYRQQKRVVTRHVVDETLLIPIHGAVDDMQHLFAMNSVADCIWKTIDGENRFSDIVDSVCATFSVDRSEAARDVKDFIEELIAANLIVRI